MKFPEFNNPIWKIYEFLEFFQLGKLPKFQKLTTFGIRYSAPLAILSILIFVLW